MSTSCATATKAATPYSELKLKLNEIECLNGIKSLVGWDEMVLMKSGSSEARNQQKAALAAVIYEKETSKDLEKVLKSLDDKDNQDDFIQNVYDQGIFLNLIKLCQVNLFIYFLALKPLFVKQEEIIHYPN